MPKVKRKRSKHAILLDKAVTTFNRWIRERDRKLLGGKCYTCLTGEGSEAGHWRHNNNATKFHEKLVRLQCTKCNRYLSGNLASYTLRLVREHGQEQVDEWYKLSFTTKKFTMGELREIIEKYSVDK